ncbi:serine/threonine-protein kinase [Kribbella sp. HUAS MG21]|uniref:non-specific serine/threonine protein kinase n=1 Tax=Kribbella sp. HUAS MG21 TaxID=3160966 RepID=A0AAU7TG42_9ACTN
MADVFAGRFELLDPIGVGGAGTVWRAWDRRQERLCAAKVLRQRDAGALLRFVREQCRRLNHPNILTPYGSASDDDMALLAMDLVGGGSVATLVSDFGPLPPRLVAELLSQLLGALDQIHTAGVLHRDVKPANLLLEATGTDRPMLRLTDFGIAIALGEPRLTIHGTIVGTPGYLAPETYTSAALSPKQDLYAAGVTAWQLLTGTEPPEHGALPTYPADATALPGPLADVAALIWTVVQHLTDPDPTNRPTSAAEALKALAPALSVPLETPTRTADGETIEVFDHLPPLPSTAVLPHTASPRPTLPLPEPPDPAGAFAAPGAVAGANASAVPAAPVGLGAPARPDAPTGPGAAEGAGTAAEGAGTAAAGATAGVGAGSDAGVGGDGSAGAGADGVRDGGAGARWGLRGRGGVAAVVAVVAIVGGGAALVAGLGPFGGRAPSGGTSSSPEGVGGGASETATTVGGPGTGITGSSSVTPAARSADPGVQAGRPCGWQVVGTIETAADGTRVECRQQGSSYRWTKIS